MQQLPATVTDTNQMRRRRAFGRSAFGRLLAGAVVLASVGVAMAQQTTDQAIEHWLAGDDARAFPGLSAAAGLGDEKAMLFLGAIDRRSLDSEYLLGLDRETRNRMLRAPGGLSGKSWLTQVASATDLADALLAARDGDPGPLLGLDQKHAASEAILAAFNAAPWSLVALDRLAPLPDTLRHLVWMGADLGLSPETSGLTLSPEQTAALRAALAEAAAPEWAGSLQLALLQSTHQPYSSLPPPEPLAKLTGQVLRLGEFDVRDRAEFADATTELQGAAMAQAREVLATAPESAALRRLCTRSCPDDPVGCTAVLWSLTGAGMTLAAFHTPLDRLVAQSTYLDSPRYLADLRRAARPVPEGRESCGSRLLATK